MILYNLEIQLVDLVYFTRDHFPVLRIVDADEFGVHQDAANREYGSSLKGMKIRKPGNYDRGDFKLTVLLAIKCSNAGFLASQTGSVDNPRIWCRITEDAGTLVELYCSFIKQILTCTPQSPILGRVGI